MQSFKMSQLKLESSLASVHCTVLLVYTPQKVYQLLRFVANSKVFHLSFEGQKGVGVWYWLLQFMGTAAIARGFFNFPLMLRCVLCVQSVQCTECASVCVTLLSFQRLHVAFEATFCVMRARLPARFYGPFRAFWPFVICN